MPDDTGAPDDFDATFRPTGTVVEDVWYINCMSCKSVVELDTITPRHPCTLKLPSSANHESSLCRKYLHIGRRGGWRKR